MKLKFSPLLLQSSGARAKLEKAKNLGLRICLQIVILAHENMKSNVRDVYGFSLSSINTWRKFIECKLLKTVPITEHPTSALARKSPIIKKEKARKASQGRRCVEGTLL